MNEKLVSGLGWVALTGLIVYAAFAGVITIEFVNSNSGSSGSMLYNYDTVRVAINAMWFSLLGIVFVIIFVGRVNRKIILCNMIFWGVSTELLFIGGGFSMFSIADEMFQGGTFAILLPAAALTIFIALAIYMEIKFYRNYKKIKQ